MASAEMRVMWTAIRRRFRETGAAGVFLLVKPTGVKGCPPNLAADVVAAVAAADADQDPSSGVERSSAVIATPRGPAISVNCVGDELSLESWTDAMADDLSRRGYAGSVTVPAQAWPAPAFQKACYRYWAPSAHLAFTLTDPAIYGYPPFAWLVGDEATRELSRHATQWTTLPEAKTYVVEHARSFNLATAVPADAFEDVMRRSGSCAVKAVAGSTWDYRSVDVHDQGKVTYSAGRPGSGWWDHALAVGEALVAHGPSLDIGFVRIGSSFGGWNLGHPRLPHVSESNLRYNRHTYADWAPDAHVVQVLTESHLSKANDLSDWKTKALGNGRYLVAARDAAPWFTGTVVLQDTPFPQPEEGVLEQARRDFGDMILTLAVLESDPRAWTPGHPHRPKIHPAPTRRPRVP